MELKDFVRATLEQIVEGAALVQQGKDSGGRTKASTKQVLDNI